MSRKRDIFNVIDNKSTIVEPALLLTSNLPNPIMANDFVSNLVLSISAKLYEDFLEQQKEISMYNITDNA